MQGFDVQRFVDERQPLWRELETNLSNVEGRDLKVLGLAGVRRFGKLYRGVSSDLIRARGERVDSSIVDYLNDLVARAYAQIYTRNDGTGKALLRFFTHGFPRMFREEWIAMTLSAAVLVLGVAFGAIATAVDPNAVAILIPEDHQGHTPQERVADEERSDGHSSGEAATFSSFLFTHNIQVTFVAFALGMTYGVGTLSVMFANGIPLGALAMQYHQYGKDLFFWAWILPHGIPELTEIVVAGGAGFVLARGLILPRLRSRKEALLAEAKKAARLVVGGMPILVLAGLIEGTISQMHEPRMSYVLKLVFAGVVGLGVWAYLLFAGRKVDDLALDLDDDAAPGVPETLAQPRRDR